MYPVSKTLDAAVLTDIMLTTKRCLGALRQAMQPQGYNMGMNQGTVAGAGIADHVHFHIVPRWNGDTNFMPVLANTKVMPDYLKNTYHQIRPYLVQAIPYHPGTRGVSRTRKTKKRCYNDRESTSRGSAASASARSGSRRRLPLLRPPRRRWL